MAAGDVPSTESEAAGFRVAVAPTLLSINAWGYWTPEMANAFAREATAIGQKLTRVSAFVLDAADMKPQGPEGQQALRVLFRALATMDIVKGTFIANNLFTKMQLVRLLRECGLDERVAANE
ncbi:MAG: hypothetical protein ABW061_00265 [Polyangiaceae bacterium]